MHPGEGEEAGEKWITQRPVEGDIAPIPAMIGASLRGMRSLDVVLESPDDPEAASAKEMLRYIL